MLRRVALVRTDVSEERITSIIRVTRIGALGTLAVIVMLRLLVTADVVPSSPILVTLMIEAIRSSSSVITRATRHNIPEDDCRENLKSYIEIPGSFHDYTTITFFISFPIHSS
jgi:cobalamin synthase